MESPREYVKSYIKNRNLYKHMLATEVAMEGLAEYLGENIDMWGRAGLLHDVDYDMTADDFPNHGRTSAKMLAEEGVESEIINAIARHPGHEDDMPQTKMDWALYSVDPLTGLIVACALMHPSKKLSGLDVDFVTRRFGEKRFAAGADRDQIKACEKHLDLPLEKFIEITLTSMQGISKELGL